MPDADTTRDLDWSSIAILYALDELSGWQTRADIQDHIEIRFETTVSPRTAREALRGLRAGDGHDVEVRSAVSNGSRSYEYRRR